MKLTQVLVLICISSIAQAQTLFDIIDPKIQNYSLSNTKFVKEVGSTYLFDDFLNGTIYLTSGKEYRDVQIQYDVYSNLLVAKIEDVQSVLNSKIISGFSVTDKDGIITVFKKDQDYFVEEIFKSSTCKVSIRYTKKLIKGSIGNGYSESTKDHLNLIKECLYESSMHSFKFESPKIFSKKLIESYPHLKNAIEKTTKDPAFKKSSDKEKLIMLSGLIAEN